MQRIKAQVVKLVDTPLWGGGDECVVQVRLLSWAQYQKLNAHVVKLVNTLHSGCSELKLLEVRVFSWAQYNPVWDWIFLYIVMNVLFLHTNPYYQEIDNLIADIISNIRIKDIQTYELSYQNFKFYDIHKLYKLRRIVKKNKITQIK